MTTTLTLITIGALGLWLLLERLNPAFPPSGGGFRLLRNVMLGVVGLGTTFLVVTPVSLLAAEWGPDWRATWPVWVRILSDLLLLEYFIYWWHRANHEVPFLWRFHRVHHYDEFLDVTSALRFHPGEVILSALLRGVYVFALDLSMAGILIFDAAVIIAAGFHHSNVALPGKMDPLLRRLFVTPEHHRVHHIPKRQATDSNYGTLTTLFDRFFGTFRDDKRRGAYGVEGEAERSFPGLMGDPFKTR